MKPQQKPIQHLKHQKFPSSSRPEVPRPTTNNDQAPPEPPGFGAVAAEECLASPVRSEGPGPRRTFTGVRQKGDPREETHWRRTMGKPLIKWRKKNKKHHGNHGKNWNNWKSNTEKIGRKKLAKLKNWTRKNTEKNGRKKTSPQACSWSFEEEHWDMPKIRI